MTAVTEDVKKNNFLLSIIVGLIAIGFGLSTCDSVKITSGDSIARVNGEDIPYGLYTAQLQRMGVQNMTPEQRQQMPMIGKMIVDQLVDTKLIEQWGTKEMLNATPEEIANIVKNYPVFLDENKKFDLARYKAILLNNKLTPLSFENQQATEVTKQKSAMAITWYPVTENEAKAHFFSLNSGVKVNSLKFNTSDLRSLIPIKDSELSEFLANKKNEELLKNLFERKKSIYEVAESRKIHILTFDLKDKTKADADKIKLEQFLNSAKNKNFLTEAKSFAEKNKEVSTFTDLGDLVKGRLANDVEKKVFAGKKGDVFGPLLEEDQYTIYYLESVTPAVNKTFESVKSELAMDHLKGIKKDELQVVAKEWTTKFAELLDKNQLKEIDALKDKYNLQISKDFLVTEIETNLGGTNLTSDQHQNVLKADDKPIIFDQTSDVIIIKKISKIEKNAPDLAAKWDKEKDSQYQMISAQIGNLLAEDLLKKLREKASITIEEKML